MLKIKYLETRNFPSKIEDFYKLTYLEEKEKGYSRIIQQYIDVQISLKPNEDVRIYKNKEFIKVFVQSRLTKGLYLSYLFVDNFFPMDVDQLLNDNWFFEKFLTVGLLENNYDRIWDARNFIQKIPSIRTYFIDCYNNSNEEPKLQILKSVKSNLENDPTRSVHLYFKCLLEAPEFDHFQLRVLFTFGESGKYYKDNLQNIVELDKMFYTDFEDYKNLTIITEHFYQKTMYISHCFLMQASYGRTSTDLQTCVCFISDELPSEKNISKFYNLSIENFEKKDYPQDDILKPDCFSRFDWRE